MNNEFIFFRLELRLPALSSGIDEEMPEPGAVTYLDMQTTSFGRDQMLVLTDSGIICLTKEGKVFSTFEKVTKKAVGQGKTVTAVIGENIDAVG